MDDKTMKKLDELNEACKPVREFLRKYYNPMCKVLIAEDFSEVLVNDIGVPHHAEDTTKKEEN